MIEIRQLNKSFGSLQVLQGLNLDIADGGIFAILGPNGSGKTTLIKSILGMVIPDSGQIRIDQTDIIGTWEYRNRIDYLPQIAHFPPNLTVRELIRMILELRSRTQVDEPLVAAFALEPFLDKKLGTLSGGTRQKVNIVLALMFDSPILILDEPTTGLDPISLLELKSRIQEAKAAGKTILITSHIMSFVEEVADHIVFLLDGQIHYNGTVQELKAQTQESKLESAIAHLLKQQHA